MTEPHVDLRDYRGRLMTLGVAIVIAAAVTGLLMVWIRSTSGEPHADPISASMAWLIGISVFVLTCAGALRLLAAIARRRRRG